MGYLLAFWTALLIAAADVLSRRLFQTDAGLRVREVAAVRVMLVVPLLVAAAPAVGPPPATWAFWGIVAVGAPLEVAALMLYMRALQVGQLGVALPLLALTPVLLLVTGPLIAGDPWAIRGAPGVALVAIGAWLLELPAARAGPLGPLRALARHPAARLMLAVAAIYAVTSALGKRGVLVAGPSVMAVYYFLGLSVLLAVALRPSPRGLAALVRARPLVAGGLALCFAAHLFTQMGALVFIPTAEMIAIKRTSLLLGAAAGVLLLGERATWARLPGAALMVAGAAWIALAGARA